MWLLLIGVLFSISSCEKPSIGEPNRGGTCEIHFALVDSNAYNICKTEENSPYNIDKIRVVMHDGTVVSDLTPYIPKRGNGYSAIHPSTRGFVFASEFLCVEAAYGKYVDKPFYLILSEEDTDTLMWKSDEERLYHNGKVAPIDDGSYGGSPFMLIKQSF